MRASCLPCLFISLSVFFFFSHLSDLLSLLPPPSTIFRSNHSQLTSLYPRNPPERNTVHKHNFGFMPSWTSLPFCCSTLSQISGSHGNSAKFYQDAGSRGVKGLGLLSSKPRPKVGAHFQRQITRRISKNLQNPHWETCQKIVGKIKWINRMSRDSNGKNIEYSFSQFHRGRDLRGPRQLVGFSAFLGMVQIIFVLCIRLVFN